MTMKLFKILNNDLYMMECIPKIKSVPELRVCIQLRCSAVGYKLLVLVHS